MQRAMRAVWAILLVSAATLLGCTKRHEVTIMRIHFERSGGVFAGNTLQGTVDLTDDKNAQLKSGAYVRKLSPEETRQLREAVHASEPSQLSGDLRRTDAGAGADQYQYDVTIETSSGTKHTFTMGDGPLAASAASVPALKVLSDFIRKQSQEIVKNR